MNTENHAQDTDYVRFLRRLIGNRKVIFNCAGAMIERDGKILFQRRSDNGKWGLIGGILEAAGYRDNPKYPPDHCFTVCRCPLCNVAYEASYDHICRRKNSWPDTWPSEEELSR